MTTLLKKTLISAGAYLRIGWDELRKNIRAVLIFVILSGLIGQFINVFFPEIATSNLIFGTSFFKLNISLSPDLLFNILFAISILNIIEFSLNDERLMIASSLRKSVPSLFLTTIIWIAFFCITSLGTVFLIDSWHLGWKYCSVSHFIQVL